MTDTEGAAFRDRLAAAIYECNNPAHRWADAHPDDRLAYGFDADAVLAVLPEPADRAADEADADTVANRAAQVITAMGAEIRELKHSRDRYRTAWLSARQRVALRRMADETATTETEQCPRSEFDGYGLQCQKPAGHNLCTFEEQPAAGARQDGATP